LTGIEFSETELSMKSSPYLKELGEQRRAKSWRDSKSPLIRRRR